jgi:aryl-alcohol dehydrogenase-like predicted oxidoreductase
MFPNFLTSHNDRVEKRSFGKTGMDVSVLGFGGAEIGFEGASQEDVDRLLHSALDAGLNIIDTAECYVDSEEKIGKATSGRRQDFFLFTKCGHSSGFTEPDWDLKMLQRQIDRSLERLQTDCVDLLQLHSCSEEILRHGEVIEVVQRAKQAGKTRFIGYSGDSKAAAYAVECNAFDSLQTSCNIADQESIELTIRPAFEKGMGVIAKRPVANIAWAKGSDPSSYGHPYWKRLQKLQYPFTSQASAVGTALRFTLAQKGVCTAIVGTKSPSRWQENADLLKEGPLDPEVVAAIRDRWNQITEPDWTGQT